MSALALAPSSPMVAFAFAAEADPGVAFLDADRALVDRAAGGDRRAFDDLYRRHVDKVAGRLFRLVGPDPEREDLIQQVFLETFRGLPRFRGDAAFSTWLYRIVVNVAYEHLRRRKRRPAGAPVDDLEAAVATHATPEEAARQRQQLTRALGLLDRLKPKKRIAFVLRNIEELSLDEIAAIVGAAAPAVGQRVKHAQRELDAMIARDEQRAVKEEQR